MITVQGLTKQYGELRAVDDLTFDVAPGKVTGFLGPNGAGKSTTMRVLMGLDRATSGTATIGGRRYADLAAPLREVGALLDAGAMHPGRSGRSHLLIGARSNGIPRARVDDVIEQVGLGKAADRRINGYSLGMRQRLGIAAALLGDPPVLLFDEPVNGLDLEGVRWIRRLLRGFADEGRTVLVSSHLMSEVQLIADRVVIIGRGRLIADADTDAVLRGMGGRRVLVRTPQAGELHLALSRHAAGEGGTEAAAVEVGAVEAVAGAVEVERTSADQVEVSGLTAEAVGDVAHAAGVRLHHLAEVEQSLEQAYLALTGDTVEYVGASPAPAVVAEGARR